MDIQLQELIEKIKKDGIAGAEQDAERIKKEAQAQAARIIEDAKKEAARVEEQAKLQAERFEKAGVAAVEQASRNTLLAFKAELEAMLSALVAKQTAAAYSVDILKNLIPELVKGWAAGKEGGVDVVLGAGAVDLENALLSELAGAVKGGVEIKTSRALEGGFRIAERAGSAYYDFSAAQVAEAFSAYLNRRLAEILKNAAK